MERSLCRGALEGTLCPLRACSSTSLHAAFSHSVQVLGHALATRCRHLHRNLLGLPERRLEPDALGRLDRGLEVEFDLARSQDVRGLDERGHARGRGDTAAARAAYECVMAAALDPSLYTGGVAADTFDGRFEMTALFASLAMRRLRHAGAPGRTLADALYRRLFSGFDYALREEGTGDATIAKKVRGLGERFYGLARAVDAGLA